VAVSQIDHGLAQIILGSPDAKPDYYEVCLAHLQRRAGETFLWDQILEREEWLTKATAYLNFIYGLAVDFELDPGQAVNYFVVRSVYSAHATVQ
jgi:hypothetical protein